MPVPAPALNWDVCEQPCSLPVCLPFCHAWQAVPSFPRLPPPPASWISFPVDSCDSPLSCILIFTLLRYSYQLTNTLHKFLMSSKTSSFYLLKTPSYHLIYVLLLHNKTTCLFSPTILPIFSGSCFCFITSCGCQSHHQSVLAKSVVTSQPFFLLCVYLNLPTQEELMQCIIT